MAQVQYEVTTYNRHIKHVFLINEDFPGNLILSIVRANLGVWGGRYNPLIPWRDGISEDWKKFISLIDPDYIHFTETIGKNHVSNLIEELKLNPLEVKEIRNDIKYYYVEGVESQCLLSSYFRHSDLSYIIDVPITNSIPSPLREFFKLNYLVDSTYNFSKEQLGRAKKKPISGKDCKGLVEHVSGSYYFNPTKLSALESNTVVLNVGDEMHDDTEIVIAKSYDSHDDLLYYWNRFFWQDREGVIRSILFTIEQLELLINEPHFEKLILKLHSTNKLIYIVSYSLLDDELAAIKVRFEEIVRERVFKVKNSVQLPHEIIYQSDEFSWERKERAISSEYLRNTMQLQYPALSFSSLITNDLNEWCVEVEIIDLKKGESEVLFPRLCNLDEFGAYPCRVNMKGRISTFVSVNNRSYKLTIPPFEEIVFSLIISPRDVLSNSTVYTNFDVCKYNDASNRLRELIRLFNNDFHLIDEFLGNDFWSSLFERLTDNVRMEGDTISYQEIQDFFLTYYNERGVSLDYNDANLRLKPRLQKLVEYNIMMPGYLVKCTTCSSNIWYSLSEINREIICKGCSSSNAFKVEQPLAYKLNHLVKNNIGMRDSEGKFRPDGNSTVLKTLVWLNSFGYSFQYLPQIDIYAGEGLKPFGDLDVICMVDHELIIGECKHTSTLFGEDKHSSLKKLIEIAKVMKPEVILLSCSYDVNGKLDKAAKYIKHEFFKYDYQPRIKTYCVTNEDDSLTIWD